MDKNSAKAKIDLFPADTTSLDFWAPVEIPTANGVLKLKMHFKYRTRKEYAALTQSRIDRAKVKWETAQAEEAKEREQRKAELEAAKESGEEPKVEFPKIPKLVDQIADEMGESVEGVLEIAKDWNVDGYPFDVKHLTQLCDLHAAAPSAINAAYRDALAKGRLGN